MPLCPPTSSPRDRVLAALTLSIAVASLIMVLCVELETVFINDEFELPATLSLNLWTQNCLNLTLAGKNTKHCHQLEVMAALNAPLVGKVIDVGLALVVLLVPKEIVLHALQAGLGVVNMLYLVVLSVMIYTARVSAFTGLTGNIIVEDDSAYIATVVLFLIHSIVSTGHLCWWQYRRAAVYRINHALKQVTLRRMI